MVFLTALCYYNDIPRSFHTVLNVNEDRRDLQDVIAEWSPFQTHADAVSFQCSVFLNEIGYLPVKSHLHERSFKCLIDKLVSSEHVKLAADHSNQAVFLKVNFLSRIPVTGNHTRDHYWCRKPWTDFRKSLDDAEGEHRTRIQHDYVMEIKARIRNCPCKICASNRFDVDNILSISDLQIAELYELWNVIKKSDDKEEYIWSFFENAVSTSDKSLFSIVYSFLDTQLCFFGLSNLIGCGHWIAEDIVKKWRKTLCVPPETVSEIDVQDLNNRPRKKRRIERRDQLGTLTGKHGWCWHRQTRTSVTVEFLRDYMEFFIERPPDESRPRLPILVKKEIYDNEYKYFMEEIHLKKVSYKWFNTIWKQHFGHCMLTDKRRFGQCNRCAELNRLYTLSCRTPKTAQIKRELLLIKSAHIEMIRNYRRLVTTWMQMAEREPDKHLFVMMDGMDQNKTAMPSEGRHRKSREGKNLYGIKLTNALTNHGNFFFWQDASLKSTTNQILYMLDLIFEHVKNHQRNLPRNLFLVFDSCSVNKSRKLFTFLSSFVAYSVFDEIQIIYLPVGHTHWFNDQIFSIVARKFHRTSCSIQSIGQFEEYLETCYQPAWWKAKELLKPIEQRNLFVSEVMQLEAIPDYSRWTNNFLTSNFKDFSVQGRNRFEIFPVTRPGTEDVREVQLNACVNSFTVEQMVQIYYSTSVHGVFGNICLEKVETGCDFADDRIEMLYRDFHSQVNQPIAHFVFEFWPLLTDDFVTQNSCNSLPCEDYKLLNLRDVTQIVREADYSRSVVQDWEVRVFDKMSLRARNQCAGCQRLQIKDAQVTDVHRFSLNRKIHSVN